MIFFFVACSLKSVSSKNLIFLKKAETNINIKKGKTMLKRGKKQLRIEDQKHKDLELKNDQIARQWISTK